MLILSKTICSVCICVALILSTTHRSNARDHKNGSSPEKLVILVKGKWRYADRVGNFVVLRNAVVQIWQAGAGTFGGDKLLDSIRTDINGDFQISVTTEPLFATATIYGKVLPRDNVSVKVINGIGANNDFFAVQSAVKTANANGTLDLGTQDISGNLRAAYYIFDLIANKAYYAMINKIGWPNTFNLTVVWRPDHEYGSDYQNNLIQIKQDDEWDPDLILHEYGHFVMDKIYPSYPKFTNCFPHSWNTGNDAICAWSEGWATFIQAVIQEDSLYEDRNTSGGLVFDFDLEPPRPSATSSLQEGAVASSLWDIYDPANEPWDTMDDGLNGSSSNGIWEIFTKSYPVDVNKFQCAWLVSQNGKNSKIVDVFGHHGINNLSTKCGTVFIPVAIR